jgi:hypothetical protein
VIRVAGKFVLHTSAVLIGLAAMVVIALTAASYRLTQGPVSLGFLVPYVENALNDGKRDYALKIDDTILTWGGWEKSLEIRIQGVRIQNRAGTTVATVPEATIDLSGRALFRGMIAPTRLELIGANARLLRLVDGRVIFGISGDDAEAPSENTGKLFQSLIEELTGPPDMERPMGYLRQITITDADLAIYDQPSGTIWRGPRTQLTLTRDQNGIRGELGTGILVQDRTWQIDVSGNYEPDRHVIHLTIQFGEFEPKALAAEYSALGALAPINMPMSGSIRFDLGTEGSAPEAPAVDFDVTAGPGTLVLADHYKTPLIFDNIAAQGRLDQTAGQVVLNDVFATAGETTLSVRGLLLYGPDGNGANLEASFDDLPVEKLTEYWPEGVKPKSRLWIAENLSKGTLRDGIARIKVDPLLAQSGELPEDALDLQFFLEGMTARYMRTLPLITNLKAQGRMTVGQLELTEGVGEVGDLELTEGYFRISDLAAKPPPAEAGFVLSGPSTAAMGLLDSEQLGFLSKIGLKPGEVGGQSATRVRLEFPLGPSLTVKDVSFAAAANMGELTMPTQLEGLNVTDGTIELRANPAGISAGGDIALNGVPVVMTWTKEFGTKDDVDGRYRLSGQIDDAGREALNIPVADYLQGPVSGVVEVANRGRVLESVRGALDLSEAGVLVPPLYWSKPVGVAGNMDFALRPDGGGGFDVDSLDVKIDGFLAQGRVDFGPGFSVDGVDLERLKFGETDASMTLGRRVDGGYDISVGGSSFDLRPNLQADSEESTDDVEPGTPLRIQARLGQLVIEENQVLNNVVASAEYSGEVWQKAEVGGVFGDSQPLTLSLVPQVGARLLTIRSEDAGSVGKGLDIYPGAVGGTLTLSATIDDTKASHPMEGRLLVDDFQVVNAPLLARILTIGSLSGIVDMLQGEGIKFKRLDSTFSYENRILEVKDTHAFGSSVGFNLEGSLDNRTKVADFGGTIVPAYTLNTVLGKVPVLGDLLLGGEGEGVFAITYAVKGPLNKPRVTVNPLSALAPGFLRGIVDILTPVPAAPAATGPAPALVPAQSPEAAQVPEIAAPAN